MLLLNLLHGYQLALPFALEDGALGTASQPPQLRDGLEWDLPIVWKNNGILILNLLCRKSKLDKDSQLRFNSIRKAMPSPA